MNSFLGEMSYKNKYYLVLIFSNRVVNLGYHHSNSKPVVQSDFCAPCVNIEKL